MKKILLCLSMIGLCSSAFADSNSTIIVAGSAKVNSTCTIAVSPINFGTINSNSQNLQSTTLTATCTKGTAFNVGLSTGISNNFSSRYMALNDNSDQLNYNIYFDNLYNNILGDGNENTTLINDIGTGNDQTFTLFGKIPTGQFVSPGTYSDLISVTLSY